MKKIVAVLVMALMAVGFEWSLPLSSRDAADRTASQGSDAFFRTSVTTLDYQGLRAQNRARTVAFSRIDRQTSPTEATYTLTGEAGIRLGNDGSPAFYGVPPVKLTRNLSNDLLSNPQKSPGLDPWIKIINRTLAGLTRKHMTSGQWEQSLDLGLGEEFPQAVQVRFWAQPLPEPESRWILITAETGLISFTALERRYEEIPITGRYRGVLIYSPADGAFQQSAAALTLYRGEDQCRIERLQFAADASGKNLFPALDVRDYLGASGDPLPIAAQGAFPSWCAQSSLVFDILNAAMMTAAEGSTNFPGVADVEQVLLNIINHDYFAIAKVLGQAAAEEYLGEWMKALRFYQNSAKDGVTKALFELAKEVASDKAVEMIGLAVGMPGLGTALVLIELEKTLFTLAVKEWQKEIAAARALNARPRPVLRPVSPPPRPAPPVTIKDTTRPGSKAGEETTTQPPKKPGSALKIVGIVLGIAGLVVGGIYLAKLLKDLNAEEGDETGSETWAGNYTDVKETTTYGEADCRYTTTGSISFNLTRSGSKITGTNTISNLQDNIVQLDPYLICPPLPHCSSRTGDVTATVNSQGNYVFSFLVIDCVGSYPQFTATVSGNEMRGSVVYTVPGMIGPVTSKHTLNFIVYK